MSQSFWKEGGARKKKVKISLLQDGEEKGITGI
jgi:hypothetical protein